MVPEINMYENVLWDILDQGSKDCVLNILKNNGFIGNCKIIAVIKGNCTVLVVKDETDKNMELPIDILTILNN